MYEKSTSDIIEEVSKQLDKEKKLREGNEGRTERNVKNRAADICAAIWKVLVGDRL